MPTEGFSNLLTYIDQHKARFKSARKRSTEICPSTIALYLIKYILGRRFLGTYHAVLQSPDEHTGQGARL